MIDVVIAGCVSVTGSCNNIEIHDSLVIGFIGGIIYKAAVQLFNRLEIDDPLHVSQIHGFCGLWGVLAVGIFDKDKGLLYVGSFEQLGTQCIGACALIAWTAIFSVAFFVIMKKSNRLRVGLTYEIYG